MNVNSKNYSAIGQIKHYRTLNQYSHRTLTICFLQRIFGTTYSIQMGKILRVNSKTPNQMMLIDSAAFALCMDIIVISQSIMGFIVCGDASHRYIRC
jgi:hypothetical protein